MKATVRTFIIVVGILLPAFTAFAAQTELNVPLKVCDVADAYRTHEPVSSGVPLPHGLLHGCDHLAVFNEKKEAVPAQFRVLERWRDYGDDNSIKWLLVTFFADVSASATSTYYLRYGSNPSPTPPLEVTDKGDAFGLGTQIFKKDFSSPFELLLTAVDGSTAYRARDLGNISWEILENGPLRVCFKAESETIPDRFGFIAWIYAYAGIDRWDMTVVLKNTPRQPHGPFRFNDFSILWNTPGNDYGFGVDNGESVTGTLTPGTTVSLYQASSGTDRWDKLNENSPTPSRDGIGAYVLNWDSQTWKQGIPEFRGYRITNETGELGKGRQAPGYVRLGNASVLVRHFWQQYPKALDVEPNKIIVRIWPQYWKGHQGIHWLDDLQRKAHDLSFRLGSITKDDATAFNHPLVIYCGLDWYRISGVLGYISERYSEKDPDPNHFGKWEYNWVTFGGDYLDRTRRRCHEHPMNAFIRTGDPYYAYKTFVAMRHSSTITPLWVDGYAFPDDAGVLKPKTYCTSAREQTKNQHPALDHGYRPWNPEHWNAAELYDGWRLYGDPLAYDAIQKMSAYLQFFVEYRKTHPPGETRWDALPLRNLSESFRITENSSVVNSLKTYGDIIWNTIDKNEGYYAPNLRISPPLGADKPFMIAKLTDGLRDYFTVTNDMRAFDMILGLTDYCLDKGYVNKCYGFLYEIPIDESMRREKLEEARTSDAALKCNSWTQIWQMTKPLAWAYKNTGINEYKDIFDQLLLGAKETRYFSQLLASPFDWNDLCDLIVERPREDTDPPDPIDDLTAEALSSRAARLTWTTPRDALTFRVKCSEKPIAEKRDLIFQQETHCAWWAATNIPGEPGIDSSGAQNELIIPDLAPGSYYFAVKSYDAASNQSDISNVVTIDLREMRK
ncbi:MAG: hypothetical protein JW902_05300 [Syntrophaceae bacterium]|nr:hypothetical protein [Syntrophaceae bacterium]